MRAGPLFRYFGVYMELLLIIQVQCPIYKFIYPESEPVLLAGDTSERQSLTRTITHYIKFYIS